MAWFDRGGGVAGGLGDRLLGRGQPFGGGGYGGTYSGGAFQPFGGGGAAGAPGGYPAPGRGQPYGGGAAMPPVPQQGMPATAPGVLRNPGPQIMQAGAPGGYPAPGRGLPFRRGF